MTMKTLATLAAAAGMLLACAAAHAQTFVGAGDLRWQPAAQPAGAAQAQLWGEPGASAHGQLQRWKSATKGPAQVRTQDLHVVVLAGTFTVTVGNTYREFGPGSYVGIPKGVVHVLGCEAAGECRLFLHHPGAVEISERR